MRKGEKMSNDKEWIRMDYTAYKDGTLVPFRCQTEEGLEAEDYTEDRIRKQLCALHKIGNGFDGCNVRLNHAATERWREWGWLKRNQYAFTIEAKIDDDDDYKLAHRFLTNRLDAEFSFASDGTFGDSISCDLGFCD